MRVRPIRRSRSATYFALLLPKKTSRLPAERLPVAGHTLLRTRDE